jgi:hypothetical protein
VRFRYSTPTIPVRYIQIRGPVGHVTKEGRSTHIDSVAKKYLGKDKYPFIRPREVRVTFEIERCRIALAREAP